MKNRLFLLSLIVMAFAMPKANAQLSPVKGANQEPEKSISLIGTKWEWKDKYEWDVELGESESEYYNVSIYMEFITEEKLYYESDWGPYGGNAENYYYSFDGNKGEIIEFDEDENNIATRKVGDFIINTDEKGMFSTLLLDGKYTLRRVKQ